MGKDKLASRGSRNGLFGMLFFCLDMLNAMKLGPIRSPIVHRASLCSSFWPEHVAALVWHWWEENNLKYPQLYCCSHTFRKQEQKENKVAKPEQQTINSSGYNHSKSFRKLHPKHSKRVGIRRSLSLLGGRVFHVQKAWECEKKDIRKRTVRIFLLGWWYVSSDDIDMIIWYDLKDPCLYMFIWLALNIYVICPSFFRSISQVSGPIAPAEAVINLV